MVAFTFAMRRHLIGLASGPTISFHLAKFGCAAYADLRVQRLTPRVRGVSQKSRRVRENSGPILTRLWIKVYEIWRQCRRPLVLPNGFADCLRHVSFR